MPLAQVRDLLGHASITTTERYDNQTVANLQVAAAKLERGHARPDGVARRRQGYGGRRAAAGRGNAAARRKFQDSFKIDRLRAGSRTTARRAGDRG